MKILFLLIFSVNVFAQNACIYQGADVLCLKSNLKFQTSLNRIITGNPADPRVTPIAGIPGDLYIRLTSGQHYIKTDSGATTNWGLVATGSAGLGDVVGPGISVINRMAQFADTTGKLLKQTPYTMPTASCINGEILKSNGTDFVCAADVGGAGAGDVVGPGVSVDSEVALFDNTTGKIIKTSTGNLLWDGNYLNNKVTNGGFLVQGPLASDSARLLYNELRIYDGDSLNFLSLKQNDNQIVSLTLTFPGTLPAANQILQSDAAGNLSWINTPAGAAITIPTCLAGEFNTSNGTVFSCATPAGAGLGDVVGPGVATDNSVALFDGATGKLIKEGTLSYKASEALNVGADGGEVWINGDNTTGGKPHLNFRDIGIAGSTFRITQGSNAAPVTLFLPTTQPANNQILQAQATGQLSWINTPAGGGTGDVVGPTSSAGTFGSVYPAMTSNNTPAGYVASGHVNAFRMFDKTIGTLAGWTLNVPAILQIPTASVLDSYAINPGTFSNTGVSWTVEGSNDGTNWTVLDTKTGQTLTGNNTPVSYTLSTPSLSAFSRFKINFTAENANGQSAVFTDDFEYFSFVGKTFIKDKPAIYADETGKLITYPSYTLPLTDGSSGYVLKTNGGGSVSWQADDTGAGAVSGPGTSTDNAIALFSGAGGNAIKQDRAAGLRISYDAPVAWDKELSFGNANGGQNTLNITAQGSQSLITTNASVSQLKLAGPGGSIVNVTAAPAGNFISLGAGAPALEAGILFTSNSQQIGFKTPIAHGSYNIILPAAGPAINQILQSDAFGQLSWINTPAGGGAGDVVGPGTSITDNIPSFADGTGKLLKDSGISAASLITGPGTSIDNELTVWDGTFGLGVKGGTGWIAQTLQLYAPNGGNISIRSPGFGNTTLQRGRLLLSNDAGPGRISLGVDTTNNFPGYNLTLPNAAPTANQILQSDAAGLLSWINTPAGGGAGDVVGPGTSVDDHIAIYSGTTGKLIKDTGFIADTNGITLPNIGQAIYLPGPVGLASISYDQHSLLDDDGNAITIESPADITADYNIILPVNPPAVNQIMQSDASGNLSWINTPSGGGATPTCTGSQRVTGNGTTLTCVDNTYQVPAALDIDWATAHVFYKSVAANTTFTFSNQVNGQVIILAVENTSGADITATLPISKWEGGAVGGLVKATSTTIFTITNINNAFYVTKVEDMK